MRKCFFFAFLLTFASTAAESFGACHAVGPSATGSGAGTNWSNVMTLPSSLVRGDIYYLMDGTYGSYNFTTSNSGTIVLTLKKAQSYDYGRTSDGCSNDISSGWNAATMGASQAIFSYIGANLGVNYVTLDGNGTSTVQGCGVAPTTNTSANDCGIFLGPITGSNGGAYLYTGSWDNGAVGNNYWIIRYVEGKGTGSASNAGSGEDDITFRDGTSNTLMDHMYLHDSGCDFFKIPVGTGNTVRNSYIYNNDSNSSCHGQMVEVEVSSSNFDWHNNVFRAIKSGSTAVFSLLTGAQVSNWNIYNNIFTQLNVSNGILACINSGVKCTNIVFIGNTLVTGSATSAEFIWNEGVGSSYTVENTLAYDYSNLSFGLNVSGGSATLTEDHNSWLNSGTPASGTGDVTVTSGAPNPFVNYSGLNYQLASENADWITGAVLSSPFNVDAAGNARPGTDADWDRGAYDYAGGDPPPNPPSGLAAAVD